MQGNSVLLGCANIYYQSALSDMPPSTPIQRPWRESETNAQGGNNSDGFLSGASLIYHHLLHLDLGMKHEGKRALQYIRLM